MKHEYKLFIEDLFESINRIKKYTAQMSYNNFKKDQMILDATVRNLEVMGEAIKNIPSEIKDKYPNIPWSKIIGFRNMVVH